MSSSTWTRCGGSSNVARFEARPWRVAEAQHLVATRRLVDSDDEQRVLEDLLERVKPPAPAGADRLHYLLFTPFRYPPLRHGSRFGTRDQRGIWYGSDELRTALAETSFYRLRFLEDSAAPLEPLHLELSAFTARVATERGVDLSKPPFAAHAGRISSPTSYRVAQALGRAMRADGVDAFRYVSARDVQGGTNVALLSMDAFASTRPSVPEAWSVVVTRGGVECTRKAFFKRASYRFPRENFLVGGELPLPPP